jgi:hypothetical protein
VLFAGNTLYPTVPSGNKLFGGANQQGRLRHYVGEPSTTKRTMVKISVEILHQRYSLIFMAT